MADLSPNIETNAKAPKRAVSDGQEVEQHPLPDQIAADQYLAKKNVASSPFKAMKRAQMTPPSSAGA